jgi:hypothetical protein
MAVTWGLVIGVGQQRDINESVSRFFFFRTTFKARALAESLGPSYCSATKTFQQVESGALLA